MRYLRRRQEPGRPFAMAVSEGHFHRGDFGRKPWLGAPGELRAGEVSASTITRRQTRSGGLRRESLAISARPHGQALRLFLGGPASHFSARNGGTLRDIQCILVIVGATDKGQKERGSPESPTAIATSRASRWLEVLLDLKLGAALKWVRNLASIRRSGALGFWNGAPPSLRTTWRPTVAIRCWVHVRRATS